MQYSLADDLSEMAAYGSFMFLLNELRILAAEANEKKAENGKKLNWHSAMLPSLSVPVQTTT